ncbi:MAG: hypothetical protein AMXMBFR82_08350 [Candidatus Hydrogenedentota bacterium]
MKLPFLTASVIVLALAGCTMAPQINTAGDLVAKLQKKGVSIKSQEPAPTPQGQHFRFDEGITVKGDNLWIDILRISDQKVFNIAKDASGLLVIAEAEAGQEIPGKPETYTRYPFVVIIRQQPQGADLLTALKTILPPEPA